MGEKLYADFRDFSLGLNQKDGPTLILDQELMDVENVILGKGFAQKRYGFEKYSTVLPNPITKLYEYKKNSGTKEFLSVSNLQLYKDVSGTPTAITGALTSNTVKMLTYKDRNINDATLIADGGSLKAYNGTSVSVVTPHVPTDGTGGTPLETTDPGLNDLANLTNFRTIAMKKDRVFAAAHPTVKNRVSFCYFDPYKGYAVYDYWPAIYFFDVAVEDNDEIVELKVFRNVLMIFCKKSVWALRGDGVTLADLELIKVNVPNGCIAPNSVQEVGNNLFYLGDDHVYSLFASEQEFVSAQIMSTKVQPILKSIGITDKALATSIFYDNKYYLSFPSGLTMVYDVTLESWTKFTNIKANSFLIRDGVLYFSANTGYIYKFNENLYSDDGQPINYLLETKIFDFGLPINKKKFRRVFFITKDYDGFNTSFVPVLTIDQTLSIDLNQVDSGNSGIWDTSDWDEVEWEAHNNIKSGGSGIWDTSSWDEAVWDSRETTRTDYKIRQKGNDISVKITNNNLDEPLSIYGILFEYENKGIK
ncbi:hypothetical protein QF028_004372 [Neobacillus sp. B4I6]|uniref:hypothetical protein n=1 Tax=Neobacillus sp. B4I6 TaxID=3373925 RepID=UPI003D1E8872